MKRTFKHGDHICALYDSESEQIAVAAAYVADGLRSGERCLYVGGSAASLERFRRALNATGIDAAKMAKRGALLEATNAETHLAGGRFDCERMLWMLNDAVEQALDAGFQGLRTCGDMSWILDEPAGCEQVVEYEAMLNQLFRGARAIGMCQFDRSRLPSARIDDALATHTSVTLDQRHLANPFYEPPAIAIRRQTRPERVERRIATLRASL